MGDRERPAREFTDDIMSSSPEKLLDLLGSYAKVIQMSRKNGSWIMANTLVDHRGYVLAEIKRRASSLYIVESHEENSKLTEEIIDLVKNL